MLSQSRESMLYVEMIAYAFNALLFFALSFGELGGIASGTDIFLARVAFPNLLFIAFWLYFRKIDPREFFQKLQLGLTYRSNFLGMHLLFALFLAAIYLSTVGLILMERVVVPAWIFHFVQNVVGMAFVFTMLLALLESEDGPKGPKKKKKQKKALLSLTPAPIYQSNRG